MIQVQGGMGSSPSKKKDDDEVANNEEVENAEEDEDQEYRDESIENNEEKTYQSKQTQFEELTRKLSRPDLIAELKRVFFYCFIFCLQLCHFPFLLF